MISKESYFVGPYRITPHPHAKHFDDPKDAALYFPQVVSELLSSSGTNREGARLIRELSLVSLYFFINGILKVAGPYEALDDSLSLDMCNFRSGPLCEAGGSHAAIFMPRGFSKSRVNTHAGTTWDLVRNPNERCLIVNAIDGKAHEFLHQVQRNFDANPAMAQFFPDYVPGKQGGQVTDKVLILPNRKGTAVEPSCKALGLTGAAEGGHYSLITMDDLVGLDSLDQNRQSTSQMGTAKKWFNTNKSALRMTKESRSLVVATRYAMDDCYADIYQSCKSVTGWDKGDLQPSLTGTWDIYYRLVEEDGVYLRPDVMDEKTLTQLMKDDFWAAMTQYYNSPVKAGLAEFAEMELKPCSLLADDADGSLWIRRDDPNALEGEEMQVRLDSCDCVCVTDLAATYTNMSAKTCRSAIEVWAKDSHDKKYILWSRVGFFSIFQCMDYMFEAGRLFRGHIRATIIEADAFQKIMKPILQREQEKRGVYINPLAVNAKGDKKARIRSSWGVSLTRGEVYCVESASKPFIEELRLFPMSENKLDTLDAGEKALTYLQRPESSEERESRIYEEESSTYGSRLDAVGY